MCTGWFKAETSMQSMHLSREIRTSWSLTRFHGQHLGATVNECTSKAVHEATRSSDLMQKRKGTDDC